MPRGREDVIVDASTILLRVTEGFGFSEVLVPDANILDGLVSDMAAAGLRGKSG
jgi:hypothetical protein